jgi:hypothetical protein
MKRFQSYGLGKERNVAQRDSESVIRKRDSIHYLMTEVGTSYELLWS